MWNKRKKIGRETGEEVGVNIGGDMEEGLFVILRSQLPLWSFLPCAW